jgi:hypothetical protein
MFASFWGALGKLRALLGIEQVREARLELRSLNLNALVSLGFISIL